jgi:hypothetical protein
MTGHVNLLAIKRVNKLSWCPTNRQIGHQESVSPAPQWPTGRPAINRPANHFCIKRFISISWCPISHQHSLDAQPVIKKVLLNDSDSQSVIRRVHSLDGQLVVTLGQAATLSGRGWGSKEPSRFKDPCPTGLYYRQGQKEHWPFPSWFFAIGACAENILGVLCTCKSSILPKPRYVTLCNIMTYKCLLHGVICHACLYDCHMCLCNFLQLRFMAAAQVPLENHRAWLRQKPHPFADSDIYANFAWMITRFIASSQLALYTVLPIDGVTNSVESLQAVPCRSFEIWMLQKWADLCVV